MFCFHANIEVREKLVEKGDIEIETEKRLQERARE
jgi:hypothetical protein